MALRDGIRAIDWDRGIVDENVVSAARTTSCVGKRDAVQPKPDGEPRKIEVDRGLIARKHVGPVSLQRSAGLIALLIGGFLGSARL